MTTYTFILPAIYGRAALDITNRTSKGFFNLADWTRIYTNAETANPLWAAYKGVSITFTSVTAPTMSTHPTAADFNTLCQNIENVRAASRLALPVVRVGWREGKASSPTWRDINNMEYALAVLIDFFSHRRARAGISRSGVGLLRNSGFRR